MTHIKRFDLNGGTNFISIEIDENGNGKLISDLKEDASEGDREYEAAIDGLESLVLNLALKGFPITQKDFVHAIESSLEAIANNTL